VQIAVESSNSAPIGRGMNLFVAGLSYKTAPVELRERLAVHPSRLRCQGCRLKVSGGLAEVVLLSTCNRVEVYGVAPVVNGNIHRLFEQLTASDLDFAPHLYIKQGVEAAEHLFSVAGGMESMVLGETEITGQVKQAYLAAQEAGLTGPVTNRLFQTALQAAKEIRTHTNVGRGSTSVGSVAVELAERIFDYDLSSKAVMIIGAGKMGEACVRHLAKKGARSVLVSNRSYDRAVNLAAQISGRALRFDECLQAMSEVDIVVSSTGSPETILSRSQVESVMRSRGSRPLFLIDIAVPRDIETAVEQLENVYLYNVDHLEAIVRENVRQREQELVRCRQIIADRVAALMARLARAAEARSHAAARPVPAWEAAALSACPA
jgi:glutamyl-tRNA reductase